MRVFAGVKSLSDDVIGLLTRRSRVEGGKKLLYKKIGISESTFYRALRGDGIEYANHVRINEYVKKVKKEEAECQQQSA